MTGWIQLHRKMREWEWFTDVNTCHLFLYCLLRANHKDTKWRGITIGRGQFITSLDTMSKETGLSVMQVRTAIKKLELTKDITNQSTSINRLITVTNYNIYQDDNKPVNKALTNEQQTDNKRVTTDNNDNNDNNENNENKLSSRKPNTQTKVKKPLNVSDETWNAFNQIRNRKKSPISDLVITRILGEADKAGVSLEEALQECCERGWQTFRADWYNNSKGKNYGQSNNNAKPNAHDNFTQGIALALAELDEEPEY